MRLKTFFGLIWTQISELYIRIDSEWIPIRNFHQGWHMSLHPLFVSEPISIIYEILLTINVHILTMSLDACTTNVTSLHSMMSCLTCHPVNSWMFSMSSFLYHLCALRLALRHVSNDLLPAALKGESALFTFP